MAANLDIIVSVKGDGSAEIKKITSAAKEAEQSASGLKNKTDSLSSSFSSLKGVLGGLALGAVVKETIQLADTFNNMEGRLKLVTSSTQNLISVQSELFTISQRARTSFESTSDLYFRLAKSTETLGISQSRLLGVTETISKTLAISGSSAESANAALIQLGQGFASGTLRGEELNSVLEQTPALAEAIAKGMGKTVGELRQLGQDGKLTAEQVFKALENQRKAVEDQFGKMPKTVGQSITQIENSLLALVGATDNAINGSGGLSDIFTYFSESMDKNRVDIIEFGRDFLRALQAMGAGVIGVTTGFMGVIDGIAGGIAKSLEFMLNRLVIMVNGAISLAESGYNKIMGLFGSKSVSVGRFSTFSFGDDILNQSAARFQESANAFKTIGVLVGEIADNTTTISKTSDDLSKSSNEVAKNHKASAEEIAKSKKAMEELAKWNEKAAETALNDQIEANQIRKKKLNELAEEQKASALEFYDIIQTEQDKINDKYLSIYEANKDLFSTDDLQKFFNKWNSEVEGTFEETKSAYDDFFNDFQKAMDNQLFDAMTGKWKSWGDWFKDFWSSITTSISRAASSQFSKSIIDSIKGAFSGSSSGFASAGGLLGSMGGISALAVGSTLSASDIENIKSMQGTWTPAGSTNIVTEGNTVIDSLTGKITQSGSDIGNLIGTVSTLKTAFEVFTSGITGSIAGSIANGAGSLYGLGFTAGGDFLAGAGSMVAGNGILGTSLASQLGGYGIAGIGGGIGGYALGSLGDKLFGANTKAGSYGAIGGSIGAIAGSIIPGLGTVIGGVIGSTLGSVIGGMFGTKKFDGYKFSQDTSLSNFDSSTIKKKYTEKSWFSSDTSYKALSESDKTMLKGMFSSYDYLLNQLGEFENITIKKGTYSAKKLGIAVAKDFISIFTDIPQTIEKALKNGNTKTVKNAELESIYKTWADYAKSNKETVEKALTDAVSGSITAQRTFEKWSLERSGNTIESLRKQMEWAQADFQNLEEIIGVSGLTVENFAAKYDEAIHSNFSPENLANWQSLGTLLMSATEASDAYNNSLNNTSTATTSASSSLSQLQQALNSFNVSNAINQIQYSAQATYLGYQGNDLGSAQASLQGAKAGFEGIAQLYGTSGLTIDNFVSKYQEAMATTSTMTESDKEMFLNKWNDLHSSWSALIQAQGNVNQIISQQSQTYVQQVRTYEAVDNSAKEAADAAARLAEELARVKKSGLEYLESFKEFAVGDDPLSIAKYKLDKFGAVLNGTGINIDNFASKFSEALSGNITESSLEWWVSIGDAIQGVTEAQKDYNAILDEQAKQLESRKVQSIGIIRDMTEAKYANDPFGLAQYRLNYKASDLQAIEEKMGVVGITINDFVSRYQDAIANTFDQDTVDNWEKLGIALRDTADAQKAYTDALSDTVKTPFYQDMMLSKVNNSDAVNVRDMVHQQAVNNTNQTQQISILYEVVKVLKEQLKIARYGNDAGVPA